jgi:aspartate aminotransferase
MPRPLRAAPAIAAMPEAVFSPLAARIRAHRGPLVPLHVGDTWRDPFVGGRMEDLRQAEHPGLNRYSDTRGTAAFVDALVEKVRARNGIACERDSVLATAGATGGLAAAVGMLAEPGEEVLILAPFWPLIRGIVRIWRAEPVEVPFYDRVDSAEAAVEAVRERISPRTVALYISTPSNPTGRLIPAPWLAALAELARRHDLWLLSDEVYEDLVYRGEHVSLARYAPERTLSAFSFSKAYGMAGNRAGYLVGRPEAMAQIHKVTTHTFYNCPTPAQAAALHALESGGAWLAETRGLYERAGRDAAEALGIPAPEGSTFLFVDVRERLDERGMLGFLEDCFEDGVTLAPGESSGRDYAGWVRLCYTAAPPDQVAEAVRKLAKRLGAGRVARAAGTARP